jgi:biotin carboxyl carrier protein
LRREVSIDGKTYQIEFTNCPIGAPFSVKINDKLFRVELDHEPQSGKGFSIVVNGKTYSIDPSESATASFSSIKVNRVPFRVELKSLATAPRPVAAFPSPVAVSVASTRTTRIPTEGVVAAPMAGKIISVKVKKGDPVKLGSVLCVLEAMKMENEIASPKTGVVEEISVEEGKGVNEGDILMRIK